MILGRLASGAERSAPCSAVCQRNCSIPCCATTAPYSVPFTRLLPKSCSRNMYSFLRISLIWTAATGYRPQVYKIHDQLFLGLAGLGTDTQTLCASYPVHGMLPPPVPCRCITSNEILSQHGARVPRCILLHVQHASALISA